MWSMAWRTSRGQPLTARRRDRADLDVDRRLCHAFGQHRESADYPHRKRRLLQTRRDHLARKLGWPLRALKKYRFAVSAAIRSLAILQVQDSAIASIRITKRWNGRWIICVLKKSDWCAKCSYRVWRNWKPICLIRRGRIWIPTRPPAGRITRRNIGTEPRCSTTSDAGSAVI